MAHRKRYSDSDDALTTETHWTAFIDTNLDTHLAMIVSDADTVLDLKKKIIKEHPQCFPNLGEINIHALMVKRKGHFYHLSDSMPVKSAFNGAKKFCFLSVDASSLKQHGDNQFSSKPDGGNQVALLCISKTSSGDRNNKKPDGPSTSVYLLDRSSFPQPGTMHYAEQKVPGVDQAGPGDSSKEFLKDLEMEVNHVTKDPSKSSPSDSKRRSDFEIEKCDLPSSRNEIPETNVEHKHGKFQVEINNVQYNNSPEGSLITRSISKKKRRSKKKSTDAVSNCFVKDNNASIVASDMSASRPGIIVPEISSVNTDKQDLNDMEAENMNVGKGSSQVSLPDTNIRSDFGEIHETCVEGVNLKPRNMMGDAHVNDSLMEASKSMHRAKKKRKRESKGDENPSEVNSTLPSNFSRESPKPVAMIPDKSMDKPKSTTGTSDCLFTEPPEDVHLVASSISGRKKSKKKKLPRDQLVTGETCSPHVVGEECFQEKVKIVAKDSDKASDAAVVSDQNVQHSTLLGPLGVSQKQKHPESVQEVVEGYKLPSLSVDLNVNGPDAANANCKNDASEQGTKHGSKSKTKPKKHHSTNVNEFIQLPVSELDNLKKDVTLRRHGNVVPDDPKLDTSYPDKIEGQRKLPQNCDPEAVLSEKLEPPRQGEAGMLSKEAVVSANLSETNIVMESGKSAGSKRIKKRAKKSVPTELVRSDVEHADNSATDISSTEKNSTFKDHYSSEAKKDEIVMSQTERTKISKPTVNNRENDDVGGNEAESFPSTQVNKTEESIENIDGNSRKKARKKRSSPKTSADFPVKEKTHEVEPPQLNQINMTQNSESMQEMSRKKTKKNQNSAAQSLLDLPINEKEIGGEVRTSNERCKEVDNTSETKQKTKSVKSSSKTQLTGQELEPEKNTGTELGSFHPLQTTKTVDSAIVRSSGTLEGNSILRPLHGHAHNNCNVIDANYQIEVRKCDDDKVNFRDYFVPAEHKHEVVPAELVIDKVSEAKRSVKDVTAKKDAKKKFSPSTTTTSDLQNSPEFSKASALNQGSKRKSHGRNSSSIQRQESLLKDKHGAKLQSKSEVYENGVNAPDSLDLKQIKTLLKGVKQSDIVNISNVSGSVPAYPKESRKSAAATSSSSDSSDKYLQNKKERKHQLILDRHHVTGSKASSEKKGKVVNNSRHEMSLLATPGAIFRDGSSESSEDGNGVVNSDASTQSPSDNSSSSGYSEGEVKSPVNGNYGDKGNDGGESIIKSQGASGLKNLPIDMILRSSSRFKKAKRTADQSQLEDIESQPVDFVPESQPNT